jgi:hypothetical protein
LVLILGAIGSTAGDRRTGRTMKDERENIDESKGNKVTIGMVFFRLRSDAGELLPLMHDVTWTCKM